MGKTGKEQQPDQPLKFNAHDGLYTFWPNEVYYMTLQPIDAPKADNTHPTPPKEPDEAKRTSKCLMVCYFCKRSMTTRVIYTRLRSLKQYLYLCKDGFFHTYRTDLVNTYYVQCYGNSGLVHFTHAVAHTLKVSRAKVPLFKKKLSERLLSDFR
jgi:hypothetical protein